MPAWVCCLHLANYFWFVRKSRGCFCLMLRCSVLFQHDNHLTASERVAATWRTSDRPYCIVLSSINTLTSLSSYVPTFKHFEDRGGERKDVFIAIWYSSAELLLTWARKCYVWCPCSHHPGHVNGSAGDGEHQSCPRKAYHLWLHLGIVSEFPL